MGSDRVISVVGCGNWGKNIVNTLSSLGILHSICDLSDEILDQFTCSRKTKNFESLLNDNQAKGIIIATESPSHYSLARLALMAGKHVLVEKPLAMNSSDAKRLVLGAWRHRTTLMVSHTMLYHPGVRKLKEMISQNRIGKLKYLVTERKSRGKILNNESVLWRYAPHDVAVAMYLLDAKPVSTMACGLSFHNPDQEDAAFIQLIFKKPDISVFTHISRIDHQKTNRIRAIGEDGTMIFDDAGGRLITCSENEDSELVTNTPFDPTKPLTLECLEFVKCIEGSVKKPLADGRQGFHVVKILEMIERSMRRK